jgi:aryl-alcohol dehydrogenase-like predicted oxidoreductase
MSRGMISSVQYGEVQGVDKPISRLVQGTVMIGSETTDQSFELLDEVRELGCTAFDTAHQYGAGDSERTFGRWMEVRGLREEVVVIGKGAHHNQDRARVTPFDITADLFDSLARLRTEYIDLYLLHRDDPSVPVGPIIETLNEHLDAGRIRAFGGATSGGVRRGGLRRTPRQARGRLASHGRIRVCDASETWKYRWKQEILGGER